MAIAILILIAVIFYLSIWTTMAYYLVKMKELNDIDLKIRFTDKSIFAVIIEQVVTLLAIIVFYGVRLNDIKISVENVVAIPSAVLFAIGFILTILFNRFYLRKRFPNCVKKKIESDQDQKVSNLRRDTLAIGLAVSMMNFIFNLMLFGAIAHLVK